MENAVQNPNTTDMMPPEQPHWPMSGKSAFPFQETSLLANKVPVPLAFSAYSPFVPLVKVRTTPVSVCVALISAPGTAPPLASVTTPAI